MGKLSTVASFMTNTISAVTTNKIKTHYKVTLKFYFCLWRRLYEHNKNCRVLILCSRHMQEKYKRMKVNLLGLLFIKISENYRRHINGNYVIDINSSNSSHKMKRSVKKHNYETSTTTMDVEFENPYHFQAEAPIRNSSLRAYATSRK